MRQSIRRTGVAALALFVFSTARADDKPATTQPPATTAPPAAKEVKKYVQVGNVTGKLNKVTINTSEAVLEYRSGVGRYAKNEKMDLTFADEVRVWFVKPPQRLDENGDPKKLSQAELDKMKGHTAATKKWYAGEPADLHAGQTVQVELSKLKDSTKKPTSREKGASTEKEFMYVTQILVTGDEKPPGQPDKKKP
jgi:hypothetical protein